MQLSLNNSQIKISLLVLIHLVGYLGIKSSFQDYFLLLTPLNLLISSFILFYGKFSKIPLLSYFYIMCFTLCLEILSVKTGFPFGHYSYEASLGLKIFGVPLLIGFNWALLLYICSNISNQLIESNIVISNVLQSRFIESLLTASMMLIVDLFIESKAGYLELWHWQNEVIPLSNYISWFAISFVLSFFFRTNENDTASENFIYLIILCLFFALL